MDLSPSTFQDLARLIHGLSGIVIGDDKAYLVRHRLEPVLKKLQIAGFDELLAMLQSKPDARLHDAIVEAITTKETSFFRDPWLYDVILKQVLPERAAAMKGHPGRHRIQLWSAGAATGQEAFSLAMLVREFITAGAGELARSQWEILANDISAQALNTAKAGAYTKPEIERGVGERRLSQHFRQHANRWVVNEDVSRLVRFRRFSLLDIPADIGPFDLIFCRNVLIYLDDETRKRICRQLHGVLHPGGWLALGAAESLHGIDAGFETVKSGRAVLYRKM